MKIFILLIILFSCADENIDVETVQAPDLDEFLTANPTLRDEIKLEDSVTPAFPFSLVVYYQKQNIQIGVTKTNKHSPIPLVAHGNGSINQRKQQY